MVYLSVNSLKETPKGRFQKLTIMSVVKRNFTPSTLQVVINLALIVGFLSQIALPLMVRADSGQDLPIVSQGSVQTAITNTDTPGLNVWAKPLTQSIKADLPDKVIKGVITAYTSTPGQTDDTPFIAASGKRVHDGMIAANGLPFGTKIKIPAVYGDKVFIVEDRMNSRYGYGRFDVWLDMSQAEARKFGVKRVEVQIFYPDAVIAKK